MTDLPGRPEPMSEHPNANAATQSKAIRYELTTEGQRNAIRRLIAARDQSLRHAESVAEKAQADFMHGVQLMLMGLGLEPKPGQALKVEGNTLVVFEPDEASSPQPAHSHEA